MRYVSTRDASHAVPLEEAIKRGIAPDGGLYVPEVFPEPVSVEEFEKLNGFAEVGTRLLRPFFEGSILEGDLADICTRAFDFPIPLRMLPRRTAVLELFHGPTAAFTILWQSSKLPRTARARTFPPQAVSCFSWRAETIPLG